ncbi:MAG: SAM-dependent methyltransferase [Propionibacteriaceae bacterium]|jgi:hypothetical protein|nr:SAM-dependent methyltransferase [Propionibacteriaceae bacterium]
MALVAPSEAASTKRRPSKSASSLVRSRQRVIDHGEVFTPAWMVGAMLDLVKDESERIDSRFLEPACGSGNFLTAVLARKFASVQARYGKSEFEKRNYGLSALMSVYGIELLADNVAECREVLLRQFDDFVSVKTDSDWHEAARRVLSVNIVWGDALTMKTQPDDEQFITFPEWSYLGKGLFQRRDFRFDTLTQTSSLSAVSDYGVDSLFADDVAKHDVFQPVREYSPMTHQEIAHG